MVDLTGRVALITGGGRGIGLGIARVLSRSGARIALNDIAPVSSAALADVPGAIDVPGDVCIPGDAKAIIEETANTLGGIDILVNNAGVNDRAEGLRRFDPVEWQRVLDVNLRGAMLMSHGAAPYLIKSGRGKIINISSVAGLVAFPGSHAYGVSKAGLAMLTRTLALELARKNVSVNCIAPGIIDAPMLTAINRGGDTDDQLKARIPLGRYGTPEDIGDAACFLASEAARYITGIILPVDGGWTAFGGAGLASRSMIEEIPQ